MLIVPPRQARPLSHTRSVSRLRVGVRQAQSRAQVSEQEVPPSGASRARPWSQKQSRGARASQPVDGEESAGRAAGTG